MRRRANLRQGPRRRRFRPCRLLASRPRDLCPHRFRNRKGTSAAGARRSFMLPTEEHAAIPKPIAGGIGTNLVRRPLRLCFDPPRWPGCWRMTGNCNWPDTGFGAAPGFDDTGAQIWLRPGGRRGDFSRSSAWVFQDAFAFAVLASRCRRASWPLTTFNVAATGPLASRL